MRALGTVPIYRASDLKDADDETRRNANRQSLDALAQVGAVDPGVDVALAHPDVHVLAAGQPLDVYPEGFAENFRKVQRLVLAGNIPEAHRLGAAPRTPGRAPRSARSAPWARPGPGGRRGGCGRCPAGAGQ